MSNDNATLTYTREQLIAICEKAIVPESKWLDRDSHSAQMGVGSCWAQLKAGCSFTTQVEDGTIWVNFEAKGFGYHEGCGLDRNTHYLPTPERLKEAKRGDWY